MSINTTKTVSYGGESEYRYDTTTCDNVFDKFTGEPLDEQLDRYKNEIAQLRNYLTPTPLTPTIHANFWAHHHIFRVGDIIHGSLKFRWGSTTTPTAGADYLLATFSNWVNLNNVYSRTSDGNNTYIVYGQDNLLRAIPVNLADSTSWFGISFTAPMIFDFVEVVGKYNQPENDILYVNKL